MRYTVDLITASGVHVTGRKNVEAYEVFEVVCHAFGLLSEPNQLVTLHIQTTE